MGTENLERLLDDYKIYHRDEGRWPTFISLHRHTQETGWLSVTYGVPKPDPYKPPT